MKSIHEIRLENMRELMGEFETQQAFADFLDRTPTLISRYAGPNPTKRIGEAMARHIELCFGKDKFWIDTDHSTNVGEPAEGYTPAGPVSDSVLNFASRIERMDIRRRDLARRIIDAIDESQLSEEDLRLIKNLIARLSDQGND